MNITSKVTYQIIREILLSKVFTQVEIKKKTGHSKGQISKVVNWLITRKFVEKRESSYYLLDPAGLISVFPLFRNMRELLVYRIPIRGEKEKILDYLPDGSILCLESALDTYSRYFRSSRICIYHEQPEVVKRLFEPYSGGILDLEVYRPDMDVQKDVEHGVTSRLRTVIDMTCDGKTYAAKDLFEQLWGIKFG